jgi:hypothetical protein
MGTATATFGLAWAGAVTVTAGFAPCQKQETRRSGKSACPQVRKLFP